MDKEKKTIANQTIKQNQFSEYNFKNAVIKVNHIFLENGRTLENKLEKLILNQAKEDVA